MSAAVNLEARAFEPISGHRALDLLATLRDRHREPTECLRSPAELDRWLAAAELEADERATDGDLEAARRRRETIDSLVRALLRGRRPRSPDVRELNEWARRPGLAPQVSQTFEQRRTGGPQEALALIAREAVELLGSTDRALIRECAAAPECSRVYLDRSPGGRRRWCHMEWCGSTAKMRRYRRRNSQSPRL